MKTEEIKDIFSTLKILKRYRKASAKPKMEGISFRYKTVQFHLMDDTFEEMELNHEAFTGVKIYSERFSLPGYGVTDEEVGLDGQEYQFEIIIGIDTELSQELYLEALFKVFQKIEEKHGVEVAILEDPTKENVDTYNSHKIIFHTKEEGIFSKE